MRAEPGAPGPVRVLFCEGNTDGTVGGSYYSLLFLVEGLKGTPYEAVAVFHRDHRLLSRYAAACSEVHVIPKRAPARLGNAKPTGLVRLAQRGLNLGRFMATARDYYSFLRRKRIGLVHLNNSVTRGHEWMLAALGARIPCVVHERGINSRFSRLTRLLAPRMSAVICISEAVRRNLSENGVTRVNTKVIYNGLDPREIVPLQPPALVRKTLEIDGERRVIGSVGNIKEWKGQEVLIRALPGVLRRVPNLLCLFVGATSEEDRYYEEHLRRLVGDLGLSNHVTFCGSTDSVADVMNLMELCVHTSIAPEPFGRVLLEAMALGKAVVGSRGGAVPEIVDEGVTGCMFPPGDSEALAEHITRLLLRPQEAEAMGKAGRGRLEREFSIARNVSSTVSLYREVLHGRATAPGR